MPGCLSEGPSRASVSREMFKCSSIGSTRGPVRVGVERENSSKYSGQVISDGRGRYLGTRV